MKIGMIGAGNMGGTILHALAACPEYNITVYDKNSAREADFKQYGNVAFVSSAVACAGGRPDVLFFCVKPAQIADVLDELAASGGLPAQTVPVSIAAGVRVEVFTRRLGEIPIVRTMPNLPAMVGAGITGIYYHNMESATFDAIKKEVRAMFERVGRVCVFEQERYIDKMIAITSSSPAYVCLFVEALADGAVRLGFTRDDAYAMAEQAVLGTAQYLLETGMHPAAMKDRVCSPAGTTIEAVAALEESGLRSAVLQAVERCDGKTR